MTSPHQDYLALSLLAEPGDPRLVEMLAHVEPAGVIAALAKGRRVGGVAPPKPWLERAERLDALVATTLVKAKAAGLRWLSRADSDWPHQLDDLDHVEPLNGATGAPMGLWLRGKGDLAQLTELSVAIVGARDATTYGAEIAADLAADVSDSGMTVVSGAAYGIDACAHRGALAMGKPTIAVLAGGADVDYPRAHMALLARIAGEGLVVSEQAPGQTPMKARFLSRNRLIAGLTQGTVVVEAARRSGSLNTLNWADQIGRATMAIPGPVTSQASVGAHEAMRTGKAMLVTCGADIVEVLGGFGAAESAPARAAETAYDGMSVGERRALDAVPWGKPRATDDIAGELRISGASVSKQLTRLEALGYVARLPTGWTLLRRADLA
ncbi:MAG: DNA-processing protein DprA [Actinomycetota bacterium]|nr:DNA-processing protein DprA [Actinomycetota bacterium]